MRLEIEKQVEQAGGSVRSSKEIISEEDPLSPSCEVNPEAEVEILDSMHSEVTESCKRRIPLGK